MRLLTEHQDLLIERISRGEVTADNKTGGYMHVAGQVVGLDTAIAIVRSCLFGELMPRGPEESISQAYEGREV